MPNRFKLIIVATLLTQFKVPSFLELLVLISLNSFCKRTTTKFLGSVTSKKDIYLVCTYYLWFVVKLLNWIGLCPCIYFSTNLDLQVCIDRKNFVVKCPPDAFTYSAFTSAQKRLSSSVVYCIPVTLCLVEDSVSSVKIWKYLWSFWGTTRLVVACGLSYHVDIYCNHQFGGTE